MRGFKSTIIVGSLLLASLSCRSPQRSAFDAIRIAPVIAGDQYNCEDMVQCVNELRHLGKHAALTALAKFAETNRATYGSIEQNFKLHLICRLLFTNSNGWKPPRLGAPLTDVNWSVADKFPLFPIAISDGVPFLLIDGYFLVGATSDTGGECVKLCQQLEMISHDLPADGFEAAAEDLIRSDAFQKLYAQRNDLEWVNDKIRSAAKGWNRIITK